MLWPPLRTEPRDTESRLDWGLADVTITVRPVVGEAIEIRIPRAIQGRVVFTMGDLDLLDESKIMDKRVATYAVRRDTNITLRAVGEIEISKAD